MAERYVDYEQMARDLLDVLEAKRAMPPSSRRRLDVPEGEGQAWRSVEQLRQFPGLAADRGEADPPEWYDPGEGIFQGLLGTTAATIPRAAAAATRRMATPSPRALGPLLRSQRGSLGHAGTPEPHDFGVPPEMVPKIKNARDRIEAAMREISEYSGSYDNPDLMQGYADELLQRPGERLPDYVQRLFTLERHYNPDEIYGPGEFPPSELSDVLKQLGIQSKTPLIDTNLRSVTPPEPAPPEPRHLWDTLKKRRELAGGELSDELMDETTRALAEQGPDALDKSTLSNIEQWWFRDMETRDVNRVLRDYLERAGGFQREPAGTVGGTPTWMNPQPAPRTKLHLPWEAYGREAMDVAAPTPMPTDKIAGIKAALDKAKALRNQEGIDYWSRRLAHALERSGGADVSGGPY